MPSTAAGRVDNAPRISRSNQWAYQRAYKACIPCRNRKSKCVLGDSGEPPCIRCRRAMKDCVFDAERAWTKKRRVTTDTDAESPSNETYETSRIDHLASPSSTDQGESSSGGPISHHGEHVHVDMSTQGDVQSPERHVVPDLVDSVMRTVVSNGNDALNLLFQAATREREPTVDASPVATLSPRQSRDHITSASHESPASRLAFAPPSAAAQVPLSKVAPDVLRLWSCTRFVKMGWLSAVEAVTLVDA
jgi:hypothetical protein